MVDRIVLSPQPTARTISINIQGPRGPRGYKGEGVVESLSEIPDINTSTLNNNYILLYDTITSKWVATDPNTYFTLLSGSQTISGNKIFSGNVDFSNPITIADPVASSDAATKAYVDAAAQGLIIKEEVIVTSTSNIDLLNTPLTIDGYTLADLDRILLKDQDDATENGIYVAVEDSNGIHLERATDADESSEIIPGMFVLTTGGDVNINRGYVLTTPEPITLESTELTFRLFSNAGTITPGDGLTMTGNTINIVSANSSRITVNSNNIDLGTVGTAGTYKSVTTDAYGRVTSGSNPTTLNDYGITDAVSNIIEIVAGSGLSGGGPLSSNVGIALDGQSLAFHNLSTNGLVTRTNTDTITGRTITGTSDKITVTNGDGVSGDPTITISPNYIGQNTITTLGTITTGVWNGSTISLSYGGTGADLSAISSGTLIKKGSTTLEGAVAGTDYYNTSSTINGGTF